MTTAPSPAPRSRDAGEGLQEPLPRGLELRLRGLVLAHVSSRPARRHPTVVHVGGDDGDELVFACSPGDPDDQGVRTDVLLALLARATGSDPWVWITRPGGLATQDDDARWLAAARAAAGELGRPLVLVLVDRHGWRDPRSGVGRAWRRLRPRP
ncbi:hypothetical protein I601_3638 [Nocardioides dokdonensis FR1436]|uniref:Uncharacterized protein n=1 Tax=Nocardioides dokdonensis FR1436 TaxID=1300347 RepID=A0A1A9GP18_9ACTN|nr:hypothetical protein [Nocardioides dokdonensis]ANH40044.1 hypothetical protein I601_3638 [Nocardioides dokdonensis FR1436]